MTVPRDPVTTEGPTGMDPTAAAELAGSLARARFEVRPLKGVEDQLALLPDGVEVTVTSSPSKGIDATLDLCERLAARDLRLVPHIAARIVRDRAHLADVLARMKALGVDAAFVIAGDAKEALGPYEGAAALLREMDALGHHLTSIGVTGYPESHAFIPDDTTIRAMSEKVPYATHIVSQICYDPVIIAGWVAAVRGRGISLPIYIGIPGAIDRARLIRISLQVGLGDSVRFLRKQNDVVSKVVTGYAPDDLVRSLAHLVADDVSGIAGWHLFTFNNIERTQRWRHELLTSIRGVTA